MFEGVDLPSDEEPVKTYVSYELFITKKCFKGDLPQLREIGDMILTRLEEGIFKVLIDAVFSNDGQPFYDIAVSLYSEEFDERCMIRLLIPVEAIHDYSGFESMLNGLERHAKDFYSFGGQPDTSQAVEDFLAFGGEDDTSRAVEDFLASIAGDEDDGEEHS